MSEHRLQRRYGSRRPRLMLIMTGLLVAVVVAGGAYLVMQAAHQAPAAPAQVLPGPAVATTTPVVAPPAPTATSTQAPRVTSTTTRRPTTTTTRPLSSGEEQALWLDCIATKTTAECRKELN